MSLSDQPTPLDRDLGPFRVGQRLGRGAMGEVWRATHLRTSIPVAIKFLGGRSDPAAVAAFHREVEQIARLVHPAIVRVFDYGLTPAEVANALGVAPSSPWLAMELATEGTLADLELESWADVRWALGEALEALAHCHARSIVHRDVKPDNLLVSITPSGERELKLSDFGIAVGAGVDGTGVAGTPNYMAPEQIAGDALGPGADLYALGCVAFRLCSGSAPFEHATIERITAGHLFDEPPPLRSRFPVPLGLHHWLELMLAKEPERRFFSASDALHALGHFDGAPLAAPELASGAPPVVSLESAETGPGGADRTTFDGPVFRGMRDDRTVVELARPQTEELENAGIQSDTDSSTLAPPSWSHRFERSMWRPRTGSDPGAPLVDVGLGLFGVREVPFIGREPERQLIWDTLLRALDRRCANALLIRGTAGTGKSRLAEWMLHRIHELGAAQTMVARHDRQGSFGVGMVGMLEDLFGIRGADRRETFLRLVERYGLGGVVDVPALTAVLRPSDDADPLVPAISFANRRERLAVISRCLIALARERPLTIWVDDLQWARDAIEIVTGLLTRADAPILIVATVRDESLEESGLRQVVDDLAGVPGVTTARLNPLSPDERRALFRSLLPLSAELSAALEAKTDGNPLFAVQLTADLVRRGVLVASDGGFVRSEGAEIELPDDVRALWTNELEHLIGDHPQRRHGIELAATLGRDVSMVEWSNVCERVGLELDRELVDALVRRRLAHANEAGWSFAHGLLVETICDASRKAGRHATAHAAVATTLEALGDHDSNHHWHRRVGLHWVEAEAWDAAMPHVMTAARRFVATNHTAEGLGLIALSEELLERVEGDRESRALDADRVRCGLLRAKALEQADRFDDALAALAACESFTLGDAQLEAGLKRQEGSVLMRLGRVSEAAECARTALELLATSPDPAHRGESLHLMGQASMTNGDLDDARRFFVEAIDAFTAIEDPIGAGNAAHGVADVARRCGDYAEAQTWMAKSQTLLRSAGSRLSLAWAANGEGELLRKLNRLDEAEEKYREALTLFAVIGLDSPLLPRLNLILVRLARGRFERAHALVEEVRLECEDAGRIGFLACVETLALAANAGLGTWADWGARVDRANELLAKTGIVDPDIAGPLAQAGTLALAAGRVDEARAVLRVACDQWRALGDEAAASELERLLSLSD